MKAITVEPLKPGTARWEDIPEPDTLNGSVVVEGVAVGVCGTDVEIVEGKYGCAQEQRHRRKRQCQQAALVQSRPGAGPRGSEVAGGPH